MHEIEPASRSTWKSKVLTVGAVIALLGLPIGILTLTNENNRLAAELERLNKANLLLEQRADSLSNQIKTTQDKTEGLQKSLHETSKDRHQATQREIRLQERVASLNAEIAQTKARNQILSAAIPYDRLKELDSQTGNAVRNLSPSNVRAARLKNEQLLKDFERVSDDFTRPKVYFQRELMKLRKDIAPMTNSSRPSFFLLGLQADSQGEVFIENITYFKLLIAFEDNVFAIDDIGSLKQFLESITISPTTSLSCRAEWGHKETPTSTKETYERGDFTLHSRELRALKATYELGESFKALEILK
jgi:hypothetical protein